MYSISFENQIKIVSYNYTGLFNFTEVLPINFTIEEALGAKVTYDDNFIYLIWTNLSNNSIISYKANTPLISPYLYEMGPSYINYKSSTFYEARPWYLAVDPYSGVSVSTACGSPYFIFIPPQFVDNMNIIRMKIIFKISFFFI